MSSEFGRRVRLSVFGESHGPAIGVVIDGLPAGETIDLDELGRFLARRRPGDASLASGRMEADVPLFLSGLVNGMTCGTPLCAMIENHDARSADYAPFATTPRPSHADYTAYAKWHGKADLRGGGHFSGRLTAPLCIAGGIAKQLLARRAIYVGAHLLSVGPAYDHPFPADPSPDVLQSLADRPFPALDADCGLRMRTEIERARSDADSVGGVVECVAIGVPVGWGTPMFDGIENRLATALFGIPALKGLEFGSGFAGARMRGSQNNDPFYVDAAGQIRTRTNHCGGILGGISTGMPIRLCAAFKPTPSIAQPQSTVELRTLTNTSITLSGRHDPCVALRATPVVEAVTAFTLLDIMMEER